MTTQENARAQTAGALIGGGIGLATGSGQSGSNRALRTVAGGFAGQQIGRLTSNRQAFEYTVLIGNSTIRMVTDEAGLRVGDCVAVERGSFNNLRLVDDARCAPPRAASGSAPRPAPAPPPEARRAADACVQAKEQPARLPRPRRLSTGQSGACVCCAAIDTKPIDGGLRAADVGRAVLAGSALADDVHDAVRERTGRPGPLVSARDVAATQDAGATLGLHVGLALVRCVGERTSRMGALPLSLQRPATHADSRLLGWKLLGPTLPRSALVRESAGMGCMGLAGLSPTAATTAARAAVVSSATSGKRSASLRPPPAGSDRSDARREPCAGSGRLPDRARSSAWCSSPSRAPAPGAPACQPRRLREQDVGTEGGLERTSLRGHRLFPCGKHLRLLRLVDPGSVPWRLAHMTRKIERTQYRPLVLAAFLVSLCHAGQAQQAAGCETFHSFRRRGHAISERPDL